MSEIEKKIREGKVVEVYAFWKKLRDVPGIIDAMRINTSVKSLSINFVAKEEDHTSALGSILETNSTLTYLNLSHMEIPDIGPIGKALKVNITLQTLFLHGAYLRDKGVADLFEGLYHNPTLTHLQLSGNGITPEGVGPIVTMLQTNTTLLRLNLHNNLLEDKGSEAIVKALNTTLTTLTLSENGISKGKCFGDMLAVNSTLTRLDLHKNDLGEEVEELSKGLAVNSSLTALHLGWNNVGNVRELARALQCNDTLRSLGLNNNPVDVKTLSEGLRYNASLTSFDLPQSGIRDEDVAYLAFALQHNTTLDSVDLRYNFYGTKGCRYLSYMLQYNSTLTFLGGNDHPELIRNKHNKIQRDLTLLSLLLHPPLFYTRKNNL